MILPDLIFREDIKAMKFNTISGCILRVCFLLGYLLIAQSCRPDDPNPEIVIETGEIEELGPTHCIIYGEILHEPQEETNGFSVRCAMDR